MYLGFSFVDQLIVGGSIQGCSGTLGGIGGISSSGSFCGSEGVSSSISGMIIGGGSSGASGGNFGGIIYYKVVEGPIRYI